MTPKFIVFEGLDGSGTSTQARRLHDYLLHRKHARVRLTSEPSGGPVGQMIRSGMSGRLRFSAEHTAFDRQMAFLFAADRHDHLHNDTDGIIKLIQEGFFVISTRYFFSSYAYHCAGDEEFAFIESLNCSFPDPDLTIYLDIPVEESIRRLSERAHLDRYEEVRKLTTVKRNYTHIFSQYKGRLLLLSGLESEELIHVKIVDAIESIDFT
jgi:dTMP kinase